MALHSLEETALMHRIAAGDGEALAEAFDLHSSVVLGLLVRILGRRSDAEEILQETFLQVWDQANDYHPEKASLLSWILMLARSHAVDRLRCRNALRRCKEEIAKEEPKTWVEPVGTVKSRILFGMRKIRQAWNHDGLHPFATPRRAAPVLHLGRAGETLYQQVLDAAVGIMGSDYASIQRFYPERGAGGQLRLLDHHGFSPQAAGAWEWVGPASGTTCGVALRTGERVIFPDLEACDFMAGGDDRKALLQNGIHAAQTTPLFSRGGQMLGMISTHWRQPHRPSERDLHLLDVLARQAADLIESS